ncbi:unnamed protein product [Closterium sp. NIES-53]
MASLRVLVFDHEGRPVAFDTWHDDLQLYLLSDIKDSVSLFDHVSGVAPAPPATADSATPSQWQSCDATARLAIRNHLPVAECTHFGQHRPSDLVTHLPTSDARYHATVPAEFLATNQPPMFITLYFIVSRLPDSLCSVRDHFLSLDPTSITVDLLEQHLLVGVARGTPRTPFFEGCSPSPLSPSFASAAAADVSVTEDVGAALTSARRCSSKGKGGRGGGGGSGGGGGGSGSGGGGSGGGGGGSGGGGGGGTGGSSGGSGGGGGGSGGSGGSGGGGTGGGRSGPRHGGPGGGQRQQQQRRSETQSPQQLRIAAAALGASASGTPPSTAPPEALHTFTLASGASRCFFRDSTTLTPLPAPVPVILADPSGGPVVASSSTVLPCPAVPSGSLSGLHLPLFSTNLVSTAALQDAMVTTTTPGGSSLYTLATEPPQVASSAQVSTSSQVAASCSCRLLSYQTLLWHHRLGRPSLPRLRGMHSRFLVSGLPRSLPPLPPLPTPPCLPCVEGRQCAAPHSSSFPLTTSPLQTLHMDIKGEVPDVFIPWIRTVRLQLRERFGTDLPVLRLHSDKGGEFSSDLLRDFCRGEGILPSFTLPLRLLRLLSAALAWSWRLLPCVSLSETSLTLRWTGEVGDASVFRVWGSRAFVRNTSADKLSTRAIPCVFLGFPPDAPGWQFYHPTSRHVLPSQDVTFDESVPFYHLFPYRSAPPPPPPLFLSPGPPPVDPLPPQFPAPSGVSQVEPLPDTAPVQEAIGSGAAPGAAPGGATSGGAEPGGAGSEGAGSGGAEPEGVEPGGAESEGAESGGAAPQGAASSGGPAAGGAGDTGSGGAAVTAGAGGPGGIAATGPGGARTSGARAAGTSGVGCAGAGDPAEPGVAGARGAGVGGPRAGDAGAAGAGVGGTGAGGAGAAGAGAVDPGAGEHRELVSPPVSPVRTARRAPRLLPPIVPGTHAMALRPSSVSLRVPPESSLPEVPNPASDSAHATSPTDSRLFATAVTEPSFESASASALVAELLDFADACRLDYATALIAESVSASPPSVGGECALGTDVLEDKQEDFECLAAAVPRFASMLLAREGDPDAPDIPTPRSYAEAITGFSQQQGVDYFQTFSPTPKMTTLWVLLHVAAQRDYELHSLDFSTAFLQGSLHEGIWLRRPPGFTESFLAGTQWNLRQPVYGLRQAPREWHDTLRTTLAALGFTPSIADPSLFLRTDTSLPPFYVLVYVDDLVFAIVDTEALTLVKSELQKRHTCTDCYSHNRLECA